MLNISYNTGDTVSLVKRCFSIVTDYVSNRKSKKTLRVNRNGRTTLVTRDYDSKCLMTKITYETISVDGIVKRSHHLENPTDTVKHSANNITVITK